MKIEISKKDLERLEDIIFGCDILFNQPWNPLYIKELKVFWNKMKDQIGSGFGNYSLPGFFKSRCT